MTDCPRTTLVGTSEEALDQHQAVEPLLLQCRVIDIKFNVDLD